MGSTPYFSEISADGKYFAIGRNDLMALNSTIYFYEYQITSQNDELLLLLTAAMVGPSDGFLGLSTGLLLIIGVAGVAAIITIIIAMKKSKTK